MPGQTIDVGDVGSRRLFPSPIDEPLTAAHWSTLAARMVPFEISPPYEAIGGNEIYSETETRRTAQDCSTSTSARIVTEKRTKQLFELGRQLLANVIWAPILIVGEPSTSYGQVSNPITSLREWIRAIAASQNIDSRQFDAAVAIQELNRLRNLQAGWDGYGAEPMRPEVIDAARRVLLAISSAPIETPRIVPMSQGRLQFEWHKGSRTLELEFESETDLHYLKWDDATGLSEEEVIPVDDMATVDRLLTWFVSE